MNRVVITGMGVVSPFGLGLEPFWTALKAGQSGIQALTAEDFEGCPSRIGGRVRDFNPEDHFQRKQIRRMSRASQFAMVAAEEAIEQAHLTEDQVEFQEVGVMIGSSIGGYAASDPFYRDFYLHNRYTAMVIPLSMNNGPSANVSIQHKFSGPLMTVDAACASSAHSIAYAFNMIRMGRMSVAVTGGADCPFSRGVVMAWGMMKALSQRNETPATACRPFSADRDGMVLGEGAGVLILEAEDHAHQRGAPILAEIKGYGATSDSYHLTQPTLEGPIRAMQQALNDAGLSPTDIDYLNAHGTGTTWNDRNETEAIKDVFGDHAFSIPVVSNKAALGHSIGASGALELIGCVQSLLAGIIPPTINLTTPDPECDLDYVIEGAREASPENILSNSFAFGGSNASLVIGKYSE